MAEPIEALETEDTLSAGIITLPKYHLSVTTHQTFNNRIGLRIQGRPEDVQRALRDLRENAPVGSKDVIESIKRIRTLVFTAKQAGGLR